MRQLPYYISTGRGCNGPTAGEPAVHASRAIWPISVRPNSDAKRTLKPPEPIDYDRSTRPTPDVPARTRKDWLMPRLRRMPYTKPIPAGAKIVSKKGKLHARYTDDGKTVLAPLTRKGSRIRLLSD